MDDAYPSTRDTPPGSPRTGVITTGKRDPVAGALQDEWEACYRAEMLRLIRYMMKCFGESDMHDAADAAQSAFAELFTKWSTVRSPRAWLRTVAFRQMLRQPAEYPLDAHPEPSVLPASSALELREQEQQVLAALRQLPLAQRQVLALVYDQFSWPEIAEITGKSGAAVRKNIERARAAMREIWESREHKGRNRERASQRGRRASIVMGKDSSGNSAGKDTELDALLSAADRGMLEAIRDNLDLDTGLAQILGDRAGMTPAGRPTGPAEAKPGGHAHSHGHTLDPVLACEVPGAAANILAPAVPEIRKEPRDHHKTLITLALAVITALNIALLCSLSHNHWAVGAQSGTTATSLKPIAGMPPRDLRYFPLPRSHHSIVLLSKTAAPTSLSFAADNAGIGGDPVISYLKDSSSGPVLRLSGFPAGTAIRFLSTGAEQSCWIRSAVSRRSHPFPSGGEQFSPGTTLCIAGGDGRVMLKTVQNQPSGQIGVIVAWSADMM